MKFCPKPISLVSCIVIEFPPHVASAAPSATSSGANPVGPPLDANKTNAWVPRARGAVLVLAMFGLKFVVSLFVSVIKNQWAYLLPKPKPV